MLLQMRTLRVRAHRYGPGPLSFAWHVRWGTRKAARNAQGGLERLVRVPVRGAGF
jgi:hypothetical protein